MLDAAVLGHTVSDQDYKKRETELWQQLLIEQQRLRKDAFSPALIDFCGVRGSGKSSCANILNKWMDPRWITTHGYSETTEEQRLRPHFWRYWMHTPSRGRSAIALGGRYTPVLHDFVQGHIEHSEFTRRLKRINGFERALADDGAFIQKFWIHISEDTFREYLERLDADPLNSWKVTESGIKTLENYDRFVEAGEQIITLTSTGYAPWEIVEGTDRNYRELRVGEVLLENMARHITRISVQRKYEQELEAQLAQIRDNDDGLERTVFDTLDMSQKLDKQTYRDQLEHYSTRLPGLLHQARQKGMTTLLVFEGPDAAGKGGAIRRIVQPLDAYNFKIHRIGAPNDEELAHHYLWRFWRRMPRDGNLSIFDRSWYGRVLVERIEGYANSQEWRRAFGEINEFEDQLVEHGVLLIKFWIHITEEEQFKRFKARETNPHKQWKLTPEDWRNREKWDEYDLAAHDMIRLTGNRSSPWTVIEGNDKPFARVKILRSIHEALSRAVGKDPE